MCVDVGVDVDVRVGWSEGGSKGRCTCVWVGRCVYVGAGGGSRVAVHACTFIHVCARTLPIY